MLYGIRPAEQLRLAGGGAQVRVYVPYGSDWYGYLVRRLAERPANLVFFLRSLPRAGLNDHALGSWPHVTMSWTAPAGRGIAGRVRCPDWG